MRPTYRVRIRRLTWFSIWQPIGGSGRIDCLNHNSGWLLPREFYQYILRVDATNDFLQGLNAIVEQVSHLDNGKADYAAIKNSEGADSFRVIGLAARFSLVKVNQRGVFCISRYAE